MSAFTSASALWYLNRATGVVALLMLTVVALLGLGVAGRAAPRAAGRALTVGLHRTASLLAVAFLLTHIGTAVIDPFVPIRVLDAVIPFGSDYRPVRVGLGAVALDLLLALIITSLLRARVGRRWWKAVHWTAYLCWPIAVIHGLSIGTDLGSGVLLAVTIVCIGAVLAAGAWRWSVTQPAGPGSAIPSAGAGDPLGDHVAAGHRAVAAGGPR